MNSTFTVSSFDNIINLSNRFGLSTNAVADLAHALMLNNGTMAQFNIFELGGSGQWMQGGMTMVGDMFNNQLKYTVNSICDELSNLIQQGLIKYKALPKIVNDSQGSNTNNWWGNLGFPNSTGSQNNTSYAIFSNIRRLAIKEFDQVTIFDTLDHQIGGVSQQQSGSYSVSFTSQYGFVDLGVLPVIFPVSNNEVETMPIDSSNTVENLSLDSSSTKFTNVISDVDEDIFNTIERLANLKDKGIITEEEFTDKKTDLLNRL